MTTDVEERINSFLERKAAEFPDLVQSGRQESRTVKYAENLRVSGQLLMTH